MPKKKRSRKKSRGCPTPHKFPYNNAIAASRALAEILGKDPLRGESRLYKCGCGKYHLSSKNYSKR